MVEDATGEPDVYRTIADLANASDERIANAASRYGLLGRAAAVVAAETTPRLALWMARERDRLAEAARSAAGAPDRAAELPRPGDMRAIDTLAVAIESGIDRVVQQAATWLEVNDDDLDELATLLASAWREDARSPFSQFVRVAANVARRRSALPKTPAWAATVLQDGEANAVAAELDELFRRVAKAWRSDDLNLVGELLSGLTRSIPEALWIDSGAGSMLNMIAPALEQVAEVSRPEAASPVKGGDHRRRVFHAAVAQLLATWSVQDSPQSISSSGAFLRIGDPATWRAVFLMLPIRSGSFTPARGGLLDLRRQDTVRGWRELATECAAWRDAVDMLCAAPRRGRAQQWRDGVRSAVERIELSMPGQHGGSPITDDELRSTTRIRARLLRLLAGRLHLAGVLPAPTGGLLGTEARALISIDRALRADDPPRLCTWSTGCPNSLPLGSHGNRRYCDAHRREADRLRVARSRR